MPLFRCQGPTRGRSVSCAVAELAAGHACPPPTSACRMPTLAAPRPGPSRPRRSGCSKSMRSGAGCAGGACLPACLAPARLAMGSCPRPLAPALVVSETLPASWMQERDHGNVRRPCLQRRLVHVHDGSGEAEPGSAGAAGPCVRAWCVHVRHGPGGARMAPMPCVMERPWRCGALAGCGSAACPPACPPACWCLPWALPDPPHPPRST